MKKPILVIPKGRLYSNIKSIFNKCNIEIPDENERRYFFPDWSDDCALFIAKPKAIPELMYTKFCEFGICGYDIMNNSEHADDMDILIHTKLNQIKICLCSKLSINELRELKRPIICATEFYTIASKYLTSLGFPHYILNTNGSTEGYIDIGADCIIDVVETGETLKANNINIIDTIMFSDTCLFTHRELCESWWPENIQKFYQYICTKNNLSSTYRN